jgi:hypothetical protein
MESIRSEVDFSRPSRRWGQGSFSVFAETGALPDGELYYFGHLAAYMESDAQVHLPAERGER